MRFVDSNVLLYLISDDPEEADKRRTAERVLAARDLCLSTQVLGEFYVQATRSSRRGALSHDQAVRLIESFTRYRVQAVTKRIVLAALATGGLYRISYWDAAIIEAARAAGATEVLTEDLNAGQDFAGVLVLNPFG